MAKEAMMTNEMPRAKGQHGHLYMQTNEVANAIIHYERKQTALLSSWSASAPAVLDRENTSRSAARKARPTPLRAREASFSHRIGAFCSPPTAVTTLFRRFR